MSRVNDAERCKRELYQLRKEPAYRTCSDCGQIAPTWASINIGVMMCINCSGAHRHLGTHTSKVRSTRMDDWTDSMLSEFKAMGGNEIINKIYEHDMPPERKPRPGDHLGIIQTFVRDKYEKKEWYSETLAEEYGYNQPQSESDADSDSESADEYTNTTDRQEDSNIPRRDMARDTTNSSAFQDLLLLDFPETDPFADSPTGSRRNSTSNQPSHVLSEREPQSPRPPRPEEEPIESFPEFDPFETVEPTTAVNDVPSTQDDWPNFDDMFAPTSVVSTQPAVEEKQTEIIIPSDSLFDDFFGGPTVVANPSSVQQSSEVDDLLDFSQVLPTTQNVAVSSIPSSSSSHSRRFSNSMQSILGKYSSSRASSSVFTQLQGPSTGSGFNVRQRNSFSLNQSTFQHRRQSSSGMWGGGYGSYGRSMPSRPAAPMFSAGRGPTNVSRRSDDPFAGLVKLH